MKTNLYKPRFKDEIENIINQIQLELKEYSFAKNLQVTDSVARCIVTTIFEAIRGCYQSIVIRNKLISEIVNRSIIEYMIDMQFLCISDDVKLNRQFSNYYLLQRYWVKDLIQFLKDDIPRIEKEYNEYIYSDFQDIILNAKLNHDPESEKSPIIGPNLIDKKIRSIYKKNWSGLSFPDKLNRVINITGKARLEKLLKTADIKNNPSEILNAIKAHSDYYIIANDIQEEASIDEITRKLGEYPWLETLLFSYKHYSNYVHGSPYSCIPHYDLKTGEFQFFYDYNDSSLFDVEKEMFLILDYTMQNFGEFLLANRNIDLLCIYKKLLAKSENLRTWMFNIFYNGKVSQ
ncbi:MAG: hypothetical protein CVT49_05970 [candidate division Zixibacteria bacterium HGW-Zixibacteria-1]|nr:MAG: hypothetical protein CVT49_05970 [candidate division Zixibacteria bacterium HGW-Zixibacteria-1]